MSKSEDWLKTLKIKKLVYRDFKRALNFSGTKLSIKDLELVYNKLGEISAKSEEVSLNILKKKCQRYSGKQFNDLIERLKMIGEIYDPSFSPDKRKEGKFVVLFREIH